MNQARWVVALAGALFFASPAGAMQSASNWLREQFLVPYTASVFAPAASAELVRHDIDDFGQCGFFAKRGVRWHHEFADGSRLELRCDPQEGSLLPGFHLWYLRHRGSRFEIARCVFDDGMNQGWYYTSTDPNVKGPVRVEWINVDSGKNDGGGRHLDNASHVTGPEEPYLDVVRYTFDPERGRLECTSDKYDYTVSSRLPKNPQSLDGLFGDPVPELRRSFVKFLE